MILDLTGDGPLTLESLGLSHQLALIRGDKPSEVLLTAEQQLDLYTEMQSFVRFGNGLGPVVGLGLRRNGLVLRVKDSA